MDQVFSAIEKDIRRNNAGSLNYWIDKLEDPDELWNKLLVMTVEDIGIGAPQLPFLVYNTWKYDSSFQNLHEVATIMAQCTKTRLNSWIHTCLFVNRKNFQWSGLFNPEGINPKKLVAQKQALVWFEKSLRKCAGMIQSRYIIKGDIMEQYRTLYWAGYIKDVEAIWNIIINIYTIFPEIIRENIDCLKNMYQEIPQKTFVIQAILYLTQKLDWISELPDPIDETISQDKIPNYALDDTTEKGKDMIKDLDKDTEWIIKYNYRISCKVNPELKLDFKSYKKFACKLEIERKTKNFKGFEKDEIFNIFKESQTKTMPNVILESMKHMELPKHTKNTLVMNGQHILVDVQKRNDQDFGKTDLLKNNPFSKKSNIDINYIYHKNILTLPSYESIKVEMFGPFKGIQIEKALEICFWEKLKPHLQIPTNQYTTFIDKDSISYIFKPSNPIITIPHPMRDKLRNLVFDIVFKKEPINKFKEFKDFLKSDIEYKKFQEFRKLVENLVKSDYFDQLRDSWAIDKQPFLERLNKIKK